MSDPTLDADEDEARDLELGIVLRDTIAARHGAAVARDFREALIAPTRPGTPELAKQDRVFKVMTDRLDKLVAGGAA